MVANPNTLVRLVGVFLTITGSSDGDNIEVRLQRGSVVLAGSTSGILNAGNVTVYFGIGLSPLENEASNIDPVTGIVTIRGTEAQQGPLPDVWWPFDVTVSLTSSAPAIVSATVVYERKRPWGSKLHAD